MHTKFIHSNLRFLSGSTDLTKEVTDEFQKRFGPTLFTLYRTTEAGNISGDFEGTGTLGVPLPGVQVEFRPSSFHVEKKVLWVHSLSISHHFLEPSFEISPFSEIGYVDPQGWLCTGDLGEFDSQGRIILQGREDDLVKIEGNRVMLHEIDNCLKSHPLVREVKTSIVVDSEQNSILTAKVVCTKACQEAELMDYCAQRLTPYKVPRRIEIRIESFSRTNFFFSE